MLYILGIGVALDRDTYQQRVNFEVNNSVIEFLEKLKSEEIRLNLQLEHDEAGLGLITSIKEYNFYYYNYIRNNPDKNTEFTMHLLKLGLPKLISAVLLSVKTFIYPVVISVATKI